MHVLPMNLFWIYFYATRGSIFNWFFHAHLDQKISVRHIFTWWGWKHSSIQITMIPSINFVIWLSFPVISNIVVSVKEDLPFHQFYDLRITNMSKRRSRDSFWNVPNNMHTCINEHLCENFLFFIYSCEIQGVCLHTIEIESSFVFVPANKSLFEFVMNTLVRW